MGASHDPRPANGQHRCCGMMGDTRISTRPNFDERSISTRPLFAEGLAPQVTNTQISNYWEEFGRGYFAMYITGPWNIGEFRRRLPAEMQDKWATAPLPRPAGAEFSISQAGGGGLSIFKRSQHKEAAWRLIEFLSLPSNTGEVLRTNGQLAAARSAWKLGRLAEDPPVGAFHEQLQHAIRCRACRSGSKSRRGSLEAGQGVVSGKKTVNQALDGP